MRAKRIDDYRKRIDEVFYKENIIYEGLITSHSLENCISVLSKNKYSVKQNNDTNSFFLTYKFDNDYYYALEELLKLLAITNNLGWYPANMSHEPDFNDIIKWDKKQFTIKRLFARNYRTIKFLFEPKYDTPAITYESRLYHITPSINVEKILKNGLVPRSRSKKSYHPERVYLSRSLDNARKLVSIFKTTSKINNWTIIMVDILLVNELHLYKDQNFKDMGYWTLNTITPGSLSVFKEDNLNINDNERYVNSEDHILTRGIKKNLGDKTLNYEY
ncbi:MAG: hypothetical protein WC554_13745 [Clostridia bacterium]